ncbi:MAG: FHA domain-containing protein [Polyangiaceae bacterium]|jgi:hypothetical protein
MGILQAGVYDHSHITGLSRVPNANTRFASTGPRLEADYLDEAYRRARDLDTSPMTAAGVRLVWWRGDELGWHDLVAHPHAFAVVGRHTKCDVVLPNDPAIALRHLLLRATTLDDGSPALRVLDLRTGLGFHLDDDTERRALVATGPLALRVGRYALVALPSRAELPEARPSPEIVESPRMPTHGRASWRSGSGRSQRTSVTTLPPAPMLDDVSQASQDVAAAGHSKVTLRRGEERASVDLPDEALDAGVLVGRAYRCEERLRSVLTESVSRVHLLLLREHGTVCAFDCASMQGVYAGGQRVRRVRLPEEGGSLRLATKDPVTLEWHPRAPLA